MGKPAILNPKGWNDDSISRYNTTEDSTLSNKTVTIDRDRTQDNLDTDNRLLRHVRSGSTDVAALLNTRNLTVK